jgi:Zn-dependent protease with chaperone function
MAAVPLSDLLVRQAWQAWPARHVAGIGCVLAVWVAGIAGLIVAMMRVSGKPIRGHFGELAYLLTRFSAPAFSMLVGIAALFVFLPILPETPLLLLPVVGLALMFTVTLTIERAQQFIFGLFSSEPPERVRSAIENVGKATGVRFVRPLYLDRPGIPETCEVRWRLGQPPLLIVSRRLVDRLTDQELDAVLAHEAGHVVRKDILRAAGLWILLSYLLMVALVLTRVAPTLLREGLPGLLAWLSIAGACALFLSVVQAHASQRREAAADAFAASVVGVRPMASALVKLSSWVERGWPEMPAFGRTHEPLKKRLARLGVPLGEVRDVQN